LAYDTSDERCFKEEQIMNPLAYELTSGNLFFTSAGAVALVAAFSFASQSGFARFFLRLFGAMGAIGLLFSATPLPSGYLSTWLCLIGLWLLLMSTESMAGHRVTHGVRGVVVVLALFAIGIELPHHRNPKLPNKSFDQFYLVADSISAGIGKGETVWPDIFRQAHSVEIVNHARGGATLRSCLPLAKTIPQGENLVLLEIGGNDLLNRRSTEDFERDLIALLRTVCGSGSVVVMFELRSFRMGRTRSPSTVAAVLSGPQMLFSQAGNVPRSSASFSDAVRLSSAMNAMTLSAASMASSLL